MINSELTLQVDELLRKSRSSLQNISQLLVDDEIFQDPPTNSKCFLIISLSMCPLKFVLKSQGQKIQKQKQKQKNPEISTPFLVDK